MRTLEELQSLRGRVALITGGAGHLGTMFAEVAAELGAEVVLVDRNPLVEDTSRRVGERFGIPCRGIVADLADRQEVANLPGRVKADCGRLDILVNNAAFTGSSELKGWSVPIDEQEVEAWLAAMDVNLLAPFILMQRAFPLLAEHGAGSIVNISSIYGVVAPDFGLYEGTSMGNPAAYNASKAAIIQLTRYFASALAPSIRVNCISPGGIGRGQPDAFVERYIRKVPLRRMALEEDFKGIAQLLISDLGKYITGQNIIIDGGMTTW